MSLTGQFGYKPFDPHPKLKERINKVILVNPIVRSQMNCPPISSDKIYCSMEYSEVKPIRDSGVVPLEKDQGSAR